MEHDKQPWLAPYRFTEGNPGRPKGSSNGLTQFIREVLGGAFEAAGGVDGFNEWAKNHQTAFYTKMWIKLLPDSSQLSDDERERVLNAMLGVPQVLTQLYDGTVEIKPETQVEQSVDTKQASQDAPGEAIIIKDVPKEPPR